MATIGNGSTSYLNTPRRQYITTAAFQNDIYQYTTSVNPTTFQVTGTLTSLATVGTGTAATCPANRILYENGKKLYPSGLAIANNTTYAAPNPGVTTYMVGVYDPGSFLSGYIDPNSKLFAPYNTDKPEYVARGVDPNGSAIDQGPPVYTLGTVTAGQSITAGTSITSGTTITAGSSISAGTSIAATTTVAAGTQVLAGTSIGYGGAGYAGLTAVTQGSGSGKATAVTANGVVCDITMDNATLNADTTVSFALSNSFITANDTLVLAHQSAGTVGSYLLNGRVTAAGAATITVRNITTGNLGEAIVVRIFVLQS